MSKLKLYIISANLLLVLGVFFFNIVKNEKVLNSDEIVLLEFRPVDPRSIMQGDYMVVEFDISNIIQRNAKSNEYKYCVVQIDKERVASFVRLTNSKEGLKKNEILLRYSWGKNGRWGKYKHVYIGADSYFFQEGTGYKYEQARYGMLKVVTEGNLIGTCNLVGLCGDDKQLIK